MVPFPLRQLSVVFHYNRCPQEIISLDQQEPGGELPVRILEKLSFMHQLPKLERLIYVQSASIALSQDLVNRFCGSSSCNFLLDRLHSSCGMAHWPGELPQ